MLPRGYVSIVVCDTRRAEQWRAAFERDGIPAAVDETEADQAHHGACVVGVPRDRLLEANAIVTAVTRGRRSLIRGGWAGAVIVLAIAAVIVALVRG